ncbi:MAG: L-aspartate oxidase [Pseudomonadota bacterium]
MAGQTQHLRADADAPCTDVLIVGAGLAGLFLALKAAPHECTVLTPAPLGQSASSAWAQGGLAAALAPGDSPEAHARDTVAAGAGLVDPVVAGLIASEGAARVRDLIALGVPFDRTEDGVLALSLEAAHSHPRVARVAGDLAGRAIMDALTAAVAACPHITVIDGVKAAALLQDETTGRVAGVVARSRGGALSTIKARETVLCTGGAGGLFEVTTNPASARGDALGMALSAGALVSDLEFIQFHPTAMDVGLDPAPLATEALRGEGAVLVDGEGDAFMARYHPGGDLAPRDEVARAIHAERLSGRGAFLDARAAIGAAFPDLFPTVFAACQAAGFDPRATPIPVAPAAHYHMGGVVSDLWGRSSVAGLSVCGECASTGAHGANRLASNSLLEAVVFARRIAERLTGGQLQTPGAAAGRVADPLAPAALTELRQGMQAHCGVTRHADGLAKLEGTLERLSAEHGAPCDLVAARAIAASAAAREESRGGHARSDYPGLSETPTRSYRAAPAPPRRAPMATRAEAALP